MRRPLTEAATVGDWIVLLLGLAILALVFRVGTDDDRDDYPRP